MIPLLSRETIMWPDRRLLDLFGIEVPGVTRWREDGDRPSPPG